MNHPVIIDVETQFSFREVNNDLTKLKISLVGTYNFASRNYKAYREQNLPDLFQLMERASTIIGFNINKFDLPVIAPYYLGKIDQFATVDLLDLVHLSLGYRVALNDLAIATLDTKKSGHGLKAIELFNERKWQELESYCLDDVRITKELYDYAQKYGVLKLKTAKGIRDIKINFPIAKQQDSAISLSLPI